MLYPGVQRERRDLTSHPENSSLLPAGRHSSATHALCLIAMNRYNHSETKCFKDWYEKYVVPCGELLSSCIISTGSFITSN